MDPQYVQKETTSGASETSQWLCGSTIWRSQLPLQLSPFTMDTLYVKVTL